VKPETGEEVLSSGFWVKSSELEEGKKSETGGKGKVRGSKFEVRGFWSFELRPSAFGLWHVLVGPHSAFRHELS
jgi:hypothetical protein